MRHPLLPFLLTAGSLAVPLAPAFGFDAIPAHTLGAAGEHTALRELEAKAASGTSYRLTKTNSPSTDILAIRNGRPVKWFQVKTYAPNRSAAAVGDGLYDALTAYADKPGLAAA